MNDTKTQKSGFDAIPQAILDKLTRFDMPVVRWVEAAEQTLYTASTDYKGDQPPISSSHDALDLLTQKANS